MLRQSEEKYRTILETIEEGYYEVDLAGNLTYFNDAMVRIFEYPKHEMMGMNPRDYTDAENAKLLLREFTKVYRTRTPSKGTYYEIVTKGGGRKSLESSVSLIRDSKGNIIGFRGISRDITEFKQAEEAVRISEEKYRNMFENAVEGIFQSTPEGQFISVNPAMALMHGYDSPEEMIKSITNIGEQFYVNPEDRVVYSRALEEQGIVKNFETQFYRKEGTKIWASINARTVKDSSGKILYFEGNVEDITSRKLAEEELQTMSIMDDLTGLYNRRGFFTLAQQQMKVTERTKKDMLLFFADLDKMKQINDTLGHQEGDKALIEIATILKEVFRESDIIGRVGGDEFAILVIDTTDETREVLMKRLHNYLDDYNRPEGRSYTLSLSIGIAPYDPQKPFSLDELMAQADTLMYEEKRNKQH